MLADDLLTEITGEGTVGFPGHRRHWSVLRKLLGLFSGPRVTGRQKADGRRGREAVT